MKPPVVPPPVFALIHSPLLGPWSWSLVAREMRARGRDVRVPPLFDSTGVGEPYWKQHAQAAAVALAFVPNRPLILVGHSGAGPLLPAIRQALRRKVAQYVFVDASIPRDGASRLALIEEEMGERAQELKKSLASGERYPTWTDDELRTLVPTDDLRKGLLAEVHARPLAFFEEPIGTFEGWPDAPCAYLQLSPAYAFASERAQELKWAVRALKGNHFSLLIDPLRVTNEIENLAREQGVFA